MSELNKWEQSIVDRLRYGLQHNQAVTLGADEVHIPMNALIERGNRRAQPDHIVGANKMIPDNAPLTLEELRGMVGSPVWVTHSDGSGGRWGIVNSYNHGLCADVGSGMAYWFDDYIGNVAYRHKPGPEGGDG